MSKYDGWYRWVGARHDYYSTPTDDAFTQVITIDWYGPNNVNNTAGFWSEDRVNTSVRNIPADVQTLEEAKAWAVATWRMT